VLCRGDGSVVDPTAPIASVATDAQLIVRKRPPSDAPPAPSDAPPAPVRKKRPSDKKQTDRRKQNDRSITRTDRSITSSAGSCSSSMITGSPTAATSAAATPNAAAKKKQQQQQQQRTPVEVVGRSVDRRAVKVCAGHPVQNVRVITLDRDPRRVDHVNQ
jgi:hypothetical protein